MIQDLLMGKQKTYGFGVDAVVQAEVYVVKHTLSHGIDVI